MSIYTAPAAKTTRSSLAPPSSLGGKVSKSPLLLFLLLRARCKLSHADPSHVHTKECPCLSRRDNKTGASYRERETDGEKGRHRRSRSIQEDADSAYRRADHDNGVPAPTFLPSATRPARLSVCKMCCTLRELILCPVHDSSGLYP